MPQLLEAGADPDGLALAAQLRAVASAATTALQDMQAGGSTLAVYGALQPLGAMQPTMAGAVAAVRQTLDAVLPELEAAAAMLAASKAQLDDGWRQLSAGEAQLNSARLALEEGVRKLDEAKKELSDGKKELADGKAEYYRGKARAEREIADAEGEIADGQRELDDLEVPTWYVFTREDSPGYSGFTSDTGRIDAIAVVIPVFFFLVSARNLFRYKKRFFMTVIGVAGCSALLVTGFGLRDSIAGIVSRQYGGVNQYDMTAVLTEDSDAQADTQLNEVLPAYGEGLYTASVLVDAQNGGADSGDMTVYLYVAEDPDRLGQFIDLHQRRDGVAIPFPVSGAAVTEKLADKLGLAPGDS